MSKNKEVSIELQEELWGGNTQQGEQVLLNILKVILVTWSGERLLQKWKERNWTIVWVRKEEGESTWKLNMRNWLVCCPPCWKKVTVYETLIGEYEEQLPAVKLEEIGVKIGYMTTVVACESKDPKY